MNRLNKILTIFIVFLLILCGLMGWRLYVDEGQLMGIKQTMREFTLKQEAFQDNAWYFEREQKAFSNQMREETAKLEKQKKEITEKQKLLSQELQKVWANDTMLKDFPDMATLLSFLAEDQTDQIPYVDGKWVCSDYSFQLVRNAAAKGYKLHLVCLYSMWGAHMMTLAIIEKYVPHAGKHKYCFFVEPMTDEVLLIGTLHDVEKWSWDWFNRYLK